MIPLKLKAILVLATFTLSVISIKSNAQTNPINFRDSTTNLNPNVQDNSSSYTNTDSTIITTHNNKHNKHNKHNSIKNTKVGSQTQRNCNQDSTVCAYYCQAADDLNCDDENYLISFGYHYCKKFLDKNEKFSAHGQFVLGNIRNCLIDTLKETPHLTCENVKNIALDSHVSCYIKNDYCTLSFTDRLKIFYMVKGEIFNSDFRSIMNKVNNLCD